MNHHQPDIFAVTIAVLNLAHRLPFGMPFTVRSLVAPQNWPRCLHGHSPRSVGKCFRMLAVPADGTGHYECIGIDPGSKHRVYVRIERNQLD